EIQTFIEDAYYYWSPAPTYVLLFGDSDFVPCLYEIEHPAMWFNGVTNIPVHGPEGQGQIGTDLMYFTVEGVDYLPEIIYGRISVEDDVTKDDANIIVNKIIEYERNPPMTPADEVFYSNILASAGYLDYEPPDDYEDEPYVSISEELREYLDSMYTIHRCYYGRKFDPDFDVDGEWIAPDVDSKLYDGTSRIENWYWDSTAANIEGNITEGRFFVFHIDHGTSKNFHWYLHPDPRGELSNNHFDGWSMPRYIDENAASLANGNYLPFVLNINCNNGWFDGEIDQDPENTNNINLVRSNDCFSENLTRKSGGGAIAAIGATRGSWSAPNGDLIKGITQALWPGILQSFANRPIYNMGAVLLFGKLIVEQKWHDDISQENIERKYSETTSHIYHLFGDPETPLWTELPSLLEVTYPSSIGTAEPQSFVVKVKDSASGAPLHYAKVCLQKDSEVFEVGYTNTHGYVTFNVRPLSGGPMNITVTMQNYKPEVAEIEVIESSATLDLIPTRSEVGLNVMITLTNFGDEIVDVYFESTLTTPQIVAVGGAFSQPRAIPITDLGPVYVQAIGQDSNRVAVKLLTLLSDEEGPDPYIYSQWDQTTWFLSDPPNLYWNNPCIQLYHEDGTPAQSNNLEVLQNYVIKACIHNDEDVVAENTIVTFTWTHFGGGQRTWDLIGTDQITIDAGQGSYAYAEVSWTPRKTGHSCLRVSVFHPRDERESNNIGQENTNVMPPVSSPGTVDFIVQNPLCRDSHFYLEVRQLMNDTDEISTWGSTVKGISPHALPMGSIASLTLEINAPSNASIGETRTFIVNVYIGGRLVGGISTQVVKGSQQIESPMLLIMTIAGISAGIAVLVVIVKKWKPDSSLLKKLKIGE
ncbi:MAG: C25 family cysteine peptidase, partial [Candidatus Thorarchaeota archaeon]